ncbi:MAG: hypothetical protein ABR592_07860 [Nitriliruptorales bacterium]
MPHPQPVSDLTAALAARWRKLRRLLADPTVRRQRELSREGDELADRATASAAWSTTTGSRSTASTTGSEGGVTATSVPSSRRDKVATARC